MLEGVLYSSALIQKGQPNERHKGQEVSEVSWFGKNQEWRPLQEVSRHRRDRHREIQVPARFSGGLEVLPCESMHRRYSPFDNCFNLFDKRPTSPGQGNAGTKALEGISGPLQALLIH